MGDAGAPHCEENIWPGAGELNLGRQTALSEGNHQQESNRLVSGRIERKGIHRLGE